MTAGIPLGKLIWEIPKGEILMAYKLEPGKSYFMPTHFGPVFGATSLCSAVGEGPKFDYRDSEATTVTVRFLTNDEQLEALLPGGVGLELDGTPMVSVMAVYQKNIAWLAGRGYNILGVSFPVVFNGEKDHVRGDFLLVLWQNLADPIIVGREELGYSKIYAELPEPWVLNGETHCTASWLGFKFLDMKLRNMVQVPLPKPVTEPAAETGQPAWEGHLHFKYIPRTGEWGNTDVAYVTLSSSDTPYAQMKESWHGEGTVEFHKATWEDLPTQFRIVNAFHNLEIRQYLGASIVKSTGGYGDLSRTRILH